MLKHSTVAILLGIVLASYAVADDAKQAVTDAIQKCSCPNAKCDAAKCAAAKQTQTAVGSKLADGKAVCANCPAKCGKTNTVTVATETACQAAQCAKAGCTTKACEDTVGLPKGIQCVVKAMIQGEYQGSTDKNVRLVVTVPGGETGVPVLSNIPYYNRVFKYTGTSPKVVVLHIPREHVEFIAPQTTSGSSEKLAPVVTKACSSKECTEATSACESDKVARKAAVYSFTFHGREDGECKTKQVTAAVAPGPDLRPYPVLPPTHISVPPPIAYSPYYAPCAPDVASCKCGTNFGCKGTDKLADDSKLLRRLATISAENAWLKAYTEARHEAAEEQETLREQLFEVQLECAKLEAICSQREELMGEIVEATIEKAELEAHIALMEERMQLQEEIAAMRQAQPNSKTDDRVESIAIEQERSRSENAVFKARIVELEAKINAISERVASQRPVQVR